MSQTVQTQFGTGTVVDRDDVRGRVSYKVEGPGFSTWIEATAMPTDFQWMPGPDDVQDNSVVLPYNPSPQTWVNTTEQNIQPGQGIDPRKRTAPADSVDFQEESESYEPGPDPKLFAANWERTRGEPSVALRRIFSDGREGRITRDGMGYSYELDINNPILKRAFGEFYETASQAKEACEEAWKFHNTYNPRESGLSPEDIQAKLGPKYVNAFVEHDFTSLQARIDENPELVMAEYREQVAELVAQADQEHLERVGRNEYLEASDPHIREAAWKDVRAKAVRLRHSGQVMTRAANPDIIASQVTGDHGTYEVMVIRSNIFQGSSAVDSWSCECPWGQWAFKREHTFVGRMCSHAYATLLELQALGKAKTQNPVYRNAPGIGFDPSTLRNRRSPRRRSSRTAESMDVETAVDYARDNVYDTLAENGLDIHDPEAYDLIQETWRSSLGMYEDMYGLEIPEEVYSRYASRTAEIVDLRPVGWDPYSRNLMNRLRDLWEEGSRPGREKERNEEIRNVVDELRERGFATDGVIASLREAKPIGEPKFEIGDAVQQIDGYGSPRGAVGTVDDMWQEHGNWYYVVDYGNDTSAHVGQPALVEAFIDRPLGYGDLPDYGTSAEYVLEHELRHREDVTEPEFEYSAGGDHGVVNDINDGGGERSANYRDADFDEEDIYGESPDYSGGDEYGGYEDPYYVDPMEREDYPEDDIVADFQRNAGHLLEGGNGGGGNDDIAAAAESHLKVAGRNFTMAEQQALIDEDDGMPYDRSGLRLDGTHYL